MICFERMMSRCFSPMLKGGGGGSSGAVDFPAYMKTLHGDWLDRGGAVTLAAGQSVAELIKVGLVNSPYGGEVAYNPNTDIATFLAELADFKTDVDAVNPATDWTSYLTSITATVSASTEITAASAAHGAMLDDRLTTEILPRFQVGMRDINAVISSSFIIGQSILEAFNTREVASFDAKLRAGLITQGVGDAIQLLQLKMNFKDSLAKTTIEANRIKVLMKKEELDEQLDIDDKDYRWGLELFQYGGNMLSSISGSAISTQKSPSKGQSAIGGALSGAAAGAMVGGGPGAVVGGLIGGIGGLLG